MANEKLMSFHGKQEIKDRYVKRLELHYEADEIIQGTGWEDGKGCAVGCTLNNYSHAAYEAELGIPRILAHLEDKLFEGMPNANAKKFPLDFLTAIPVGVDLTNVWKRFIIWVLIDANEGVIRHAKTDRVKKSIQVVADAYTLELTGTLVPVEKWQELRKSSYAYAAAAYAYAAAAYAADAAAYAAAAYAADAAADAAAAAAYAAAAAAADAAAAAAADAADAARGALRTAARERKYIVMAAKLIELLKAA